MARNRQKKLGKTEVSFWDTVPRGKTQEFMVGTDSSSVVEIMQKSLVRSSTRAKKMMGDTGGSDGTSVWFDHCGRKVVRFVALSPINFIEN